MKAIEYRTIDKSSWPRGPWDAEPDKLQWLDATTGLPCLIVRVPHHGALCGYVGVPSSHPLHGRGDETDLEVHGGITFAAPCGHGDESADVCHVPGPGEPDDVWWIGFDCAHAGNAMPAVPREFTVLASGTYRDVGYVRDQVAYLAQQLAVLALAGGKR